MREPGRPIRARKKITRAIEGRIAEVAPELIDVVIEEARKDSWLALELLKLFIR